MAVLFVGTKWRVFVIGLLLLIVLAANADVTEVVVNPDADVKPLQGAGELQSILKRGMLRVGVSTYLPPFVMRDASGKLYGYDIDLAKGIAKKLNVSLQLWSSRRVEILPSYVNKGVVDIAISCLTMTTVSYKKVLFSKPYLLASYAFVANRWAAEKFLLSNNLVNYNNEKLRIGYVAWVTPKAVLQYFFPKAKLVNLKQYYWAIDAMRRGEVDCIFGNYIVLKYWYLLTPDLPIRYRLTRLGKWYNYIGIAINFKSIELRGWLDHYIDRYQSEDRFKSYRRFSKYYNKLKFWLHGSAAGRGKP